MQEAAREIIRKETAGKDSPQALAQAVERTFARLEGLMVTLVGELGFRAVLDRAIYLTDERWPWLTRHRVQSHSTLLIRQLSGPQSSEGRARVSATFAISGLEEAAVEHGYENVCAAATTLLAEVIGLLCSFIGEGLTFRVLSRGWKGIE